ncbi:hypothetical protein JTS96_02525 [Clostridium botulinum]|nr:hypothetical protein [Clostridium botulinum]
MDHQQRQEQRNCFRRKSKEFIMDETRLRLKDIKRIEREITEKL